MRHLHSAVIALLASLFFQPMGVLAQDVPEEAAEEISNDSIPAANLLIMVSTLSDESTPSLLKGIIPPSPQAAELARYAEYPIGYSSGIPSISVPLYEIQLGGFSLPISLSYHASGARPDQMPTCVGSGWSLNAGGAISRTVLGKPDMYRTGASSSDYTYFDLDNVHNLVYRVFHNTGDPTDLHSILSDSPDVDTESDRYTFNVAGRTGVFRYSYADGKFIILNNSNDRVYADGSTMGMGITFTIYGSDGIEYEFAQEEQTGAPDNFNGKPFTSTWYVTAIRTPYGDIDFTYELAPSIDIICNSSTANAGARPRYYDEGGFDMIYTIQSSQSTSNLSYGQVNLSKIEWDGNRIEFSYADDNPGKTLRRLTSMKVYSSADELRKSISFDNTDNWPTGESLTGRRLLKTVTDSECGTWKFEYDKKNSLPPLTKIRNTETQTDYWGYLNTSTPSSYKAVFTQEQSDWLNEKKNGCSGLGLPWTEGSVSTRDRNPSLEHTKAGVLTKVTFPTGGYAEYEYELNRCNNRYYGGLRIKSQTIFDGAGSSGRKTSYTYGTSYPTEEDPEDLMRFHSEEFYHLPTATDDVPIDYWTVVTSPINPVTSSSGSVIYLDVTETRADGSSTHYTFDHAGIGALYGVPDEFTHPSLFEQSRRDFGCREPLLTEKSVYDSSKTKVYEERYTYRQAERQTFVTGVRTACPYIEIDEQDGVTITPSFVARWSELQYASSYATVLAHVPESKTTEFCGTGFSTTENYTYDSGFRTMLPRSVSSIGSDGSIFKTEHTFPFDRTGDVDKAMTEAGFTDFPVATETYAGTSLVARSVTDYIEHSGFYLPKKISSWSLPTGTDPSKATPSLRVREQVSSYNAKGRPLSITVNATDVTSFTWNTGGTLIESSTAPGGLKTTYTHRPLFGLASMTAPNGLKTSYTYNAAGMLKEISDQSGPLETYTYSIRSLPGMNIDGNSIATQRWLDSSKSKGVLTKQYYSQLGLETTMIQGGMNTSGEYLFSTTGYDKLGRPTVRILPGAGGKSPDFSPYNDVMGFARSTYGENWVSSSTGYDALDRPVKVTPPGDAWYDGNKCRRTHYISNAANSVRLYTAPLASVSLKKSGYYEAGTLQGVRTVDEDGNEMTVYTDRLGRKVLERRGPESKKGDNDTYFVYNDLGQLRFVLTPGYELSGYKDKFAYEYRYDQDGNVVKKFLPDAGYTQYWYDRAGRLTYMQDPNLRNAGKYRFFIYDQAGRQVLQGLAGPCDRDEEVNVGSYTGNGGFLDTGYSLTQETRLKNATLESVAYYDTYGFVDLLDSRLSKTGTASAKGMQTGSITYASDGTRSLSAVYYDIRGNIVENREITSFGTQRVTASTYTYSGQPLRTTMTEGDVKLITENTYDTASGLLTATDVTVNGTKQRVSAVTYDDLGRIASVTRGEATRSGGKVSYAYNIHGQTTKISGPGFSQDLYYDDWSGTRLYNGSVSAMTWKMGTDQTLRGYKYSYNGYGWLTAAEYGEGSSLSTNKDRYTEKSLDFMRNGGIRRLQRHGLKADGNFGKIDNLHIYYDGNRITSVLEDAEAVTQNGSMDYPGLQQEMAFGYNEWGSMVSDESRGITDIAYDYLGNPTKIQFESGRYITNVYSATGEKLVTKTRTKPVRPPSPPPGPPEEAESVDQPDLSPASVLAAPPATGTTTEYHGPLIYVNGSLDMVLFPGGYATVSGDDVTFHYYTQDYLGNNRAVINGSTGAIEQTMAYYPYGGVIADLGNPTTGQPYKFGGKELVSANGLNEYDFGARRYYQAVPHFTSLDPMCEKYYWLSPYLYCANNPVNAFDPDGNIIIFVNGFHFGDGGSSKYWNGVDTQIMKIVGDNIARYVDGAMGGATALVNASGISKSNLNVNARISAGFQDGYDNCQSIMEVADATESTVKFVSHSMGSAYTKGMIQGMLQYASENDMNISGKFEFEVDFAPYQSSEQSPIINKTIVFQHSFDGVAGEKPMPGAKNIVTHKTPSFDLFNAGSILLREHKITSFTDDINNDLERELK